MKKTGHNSFRVSISWARMFPNGGTGKVNPKAISFYRKLFSEMNNNGIKVFANLYHFDMPATLQDKGGWESREVVDAYVHYAETCFKEFGDLVCHWFTFNEPLGPILGTYLEDFHYPNLIDFKRGAQAAFFTILAHAKAIQVFKELALPSKIGVILNLSPTFPRSQNPADVKAAEIADLFYTRSFLDPMVKGNFSKKLILLLQEYNQLPEDYTKEDLVCIYENTAQILGLNYYEPRRVKSRSSMVDTSSPFLPEWFFEPHIMPGRRMNEYRAAENPYVDKTPYGWVVDPTGLRLTLRKLYDRYDLPILITENGYGAPDIVEEDRRINDQDRIDYLAKHILAIQAALTDGVDVFGYLPWSAIDVVSTHQGFNKRYGFIYVDRTDENLKELKRIKKESFFWYQKVIARNGLA